MASLVKWLFGSGAHGVDGLPVATGTAYFYTPGSTSEQITVYADPTELEILAQPVTLDAAGRAEVYAKVPFEIKVLDALGAQVLLSERAESVDAAQVYCSWGGAAQPLSTILANLQYNFSGSTTGNALYRESLATGTVNQFYYDVLHNHISPYNFGAVWDGAADDVTPLQRAINRAIVTGLPLLLPPGTCNVSAGLTVNGPITIIGAGKDLTTITATAEGYNLLTVDAGVSPAGVHMSDFGLTIPWTSGTDAALYVTRAQRATFQRLLLTAFKGVTGITADFLSCTVTDCHAVVPAASAYGFDLGDSCAIQACTVTSTGGTVGTAFKENGNGSVIGCQAIGVATGFDISATGVVIGCQAVLCGSDTSLADQSASFGNSWDLRDDLVSTHGITINYGTIADCTIEQPHYKGGVKTVSFKVVGATASVTISLGGAAAFATGATNIQVTFLDTDSSDRTVGIADVNTLTVQFTTVTSTGFFVTVKGT